LRFDLGVAIRRARWRRSQHSYSLALASAAAFRFILELLVVKKQLFPGSENKITPAIDTLEHLVLKFH
jgi:hypothetical protein